MSLASLPADVVWNLTKYLLSSYEGPFRPGAEEHGRVLDLLRVQVSLPATLRLFNGSLRPSQ